MSLEPLYDQHFTTPEEHTSNTIEAAVHVLKALDCPSRLRPMLVILLGVLAGQDRSVTFYRQDISRRLYGGSTAMSEAEEARGLRKVSRLLSHLSDWIHGAGLREVIDYQPGTKEEPGRISTRLIIWIAEIAKRADDVPDLGSLNGEARSARFREWAEEIVGRRLRRATAETERPKRTHHSGVYYRQGKGFLRKWILEKMGESSTDPASFEDELEGLMSFLQNDLRREVRALCNHFWQEEERDLAVDEEPKMDIKDLPCTQIWQEEKVQEEEPSLPSLAPSLSLTAQFVANTTSGREGAHWQALAAAATVGALPDRAILGGNQEEIVGAWRLGQERDAGRAFTWPTFLREGFDHLVRRSHSERRSLIVGLPSAFHRDDCSLEDVEQMRQWAWLIVETSPGSYQSWFRLPDHENTQHGREAFHVALDRFGIGGNRGARHSGRWPGTINGKPSRNGWEVSIWDVSPGRLVTLAHVGAVIRPDSGCIPTSTPTIKNASKGNSGQWPDYQRALEEHRGDRSRADASWFRIAFKRGFDVEEIADRLMSVSDRARQRGRRAIGQELHHLARTGRVSV